MAQKIARRIPYYRHVGDVDTPSAYVRTQITITGDIECTLLHSPTGSCTTVLLNRTQTQEIIRLLQETIRQAD